MIKIAGLLFFLLEVFFEKASAVASELHERRMELKAAKRSQWLLTLDPDALRKEGDLGSAILARQAEIAQVSSRKGGINRGPSKVISRPPPPGPTRHAK
jgi:hypothetical protein